jgi:alpha-N-arabinofuranosidase
MVACAPMFVNINPGACQWPVHLIGYDELRSYGSSSYDMQSMFALYSGNVVLPATLTARGGSQVVQSVTADRAFGRIFIKLVNGAGSAQPLQITLNG